MGTQPSRRTLLGAIAIAPVALAAGSATAASSISSDPVWRKLVADFQTKYAAWLATIDLEDDARKTFHDACAPLPPEPTRPSSGNDGDILDKTVRELRDACNAPEQKAVWSDYERELSIWTVQREALRERYVGPAKAAYNRAFDARCDAFEALVTHRVTNLCDLGEKIEIIAKDYEGSDFPSEYIADVLADVRRLCGEADA